jgi:hypothetical protein
MCWVGIGEDRSALDAQGRRRAWLAVGCIRRWLRIEDASNAATESLVCERWFRYRVGAKASGAAHAVTSRFGRL